MGRVRWIVCALLFFATTINYVDRQVLGILAPDLQRSIGWALYALRKYFSTYGRDSVNGARVNWNEVVIVTATTRLERLERRFPRQHDCRLRHG